MNEHNNRSCQICRIHLHHPQANYCKRCKRLIDRVDIRNKPDKAARAKALSEAWDGEGFRRYYTGGRLIEDNYRDPRYLTFDHPTPSRPPHAEGRKQDSSGCRRHQ